MDAPSASAFVAPASPPVTTITSAKENIAPITVPCILKSAALKEPPTARPSLVPTIATVTAAHKPLPLVAQPIKPATAAAKDSLVAYKSWFASSWKSQRSRAATVSAPRAGSANRGGARRGAGDRADGDSDAAAAELLGVPALEAAAEAAAGDAGDGVIAETKPSPPPSPPTRSVCRGGSFPADSPPLPAKDVGNDDARARGDLFFPLSPAPARRTFRGVGFLFSRSRRSPSRSSKSPHASHSTSSPPAFRPSRVSSCPAKTKPPLSSLSGSKNAASSRASDWKLNIHRWFACSARRATDSPASDATPPGA